MKRLHVHVRVADLDDNIRFYSSLFDAAPTVHKEDYAKWELEEPCVNFAISARSAHHGVDHLGIQVDSATELAELKARLDRAGAATVPEADAACCYARSDKHWATDPSGLSWESFQSHASLDTFDGAVEEHACCPTATAAACC